MLNDFKKSIYETLIHNNDIPTSKSKWLSIFEDINIDWRTVYGWVLDCTRDTYLQWLQIRIAHRILATKSLLYKMKLSTDNYCTFCNSNEETIEHLFWHCCNVKPLLEHIISKIKEIDRELKVDCLLVILGGGKNMYKWNILFLEFKRYIYLCQRKNTKPTVNGFNNSLRLAWEIYKVSNMSFIENDNWTIVRSFIS